MKKNWGRSLQWIICVLHCNELPLRTIIKDIDGGTTGPHGFKNLIGKKLYECEKLPLVKLRKIDGEPISNDIDEQSTDLKSSNIRVLFQ